uniref:hypothetical protein n=1 Tax=Orrella sp. TaxID=1921583 RepID=UPI0040472BCA
MKKADTPKTIKQILEPYPVIEEGGKNLPSTEPLDEPQEVLPSMAFDYLTLAKQGDSQAWGKLYKMLASYLANGRTVPAPLAEIMSKRCADTAEVLLLPTGDRRKALPQAVAPGAKRGRKKAPLDLEDMFAVEALAIAGNNPSDDELLIAVKKLVSMLPQKTDLKTPVKSLQKPASVPLYSVSSILIKAKKRLI